MVPRVVGSPEGTPLEEPHWLPIFKKLSFIESFLNNTIHQKPLLKAFEGKKRADFALFLPK